MTSFEEYSTPSPSALYSANFFASLTFKQAVSFFDEYPTIAEAPSCISVSFTDEIPTTAAANVIVPGELIPNIEDIVQLSAGMRAAFQQGKRSVSACFSSKEGLIVKNYHFSKVTLMKMLNNHKSILDFSAALCRHMVTLGLDEETKSSFLSQRILQPIHGFYGARFPLWKLGYLLGENYIEEDVMNALSELTYLEKSLCHPSIRYPPYLLLPTSFLSDSRYLFQHYGQMYSPEIASLRERLKSTNVEMIAFLDCSNQHYSAYVLHDQVLYHADSLGHQTARDICSILSWVLPDQSKAPKRVAEVPIPRQRLTGISSGSCGLAALDFIKARFSLHRELPQWDPTCSVQHRNQALLDLMKYHLIALRVAETMPPHLWTHHCIDKVNTEPVGFCGYNDYNILCAMDSHPIYTFYSPVEQDQPDQHATQASRTPMSPQVKQEEHEERVPLILDLPTSPTGKGHGVVSLEETLTGRGVDLSRPNMIEVKKEQLDITLDGLPSDTSPQSHRSSTTHIKAESIDSIPSIHSFPSTPTPTLKPSFPLVIDLTKSPSREPDSSPRIMPCKRRRSTSPNLFSPRRSSVSPNLDRVTKRSRSASIILASSPHAVKLERSPEVTVIPNRLKQGTYYLTWQDAQAAILEQQAALGFKFIKNQTKRDPSGEIRRITFRCSSHSIHVPRHDVTIDPSDHRRGKTIKTNCSAHVNVSRNAGGWHLSLVNLEHNHQRTIPEGGCIARPPTDEQKAIISELAAIPGLNRSQIAAVVSSREVFSEPLESRQISNVMNSARNEARERIQAAGGDFAAVLADLRAKLSEGWYHDVQMDEDNFITGIFWQSAEQIRLGQRYSDVLLNDNSYGRNNVGYATNIGIIIDNCGRSRNVYYAIHAKEDAATYSWVLRAYLKNLPNAPEVIATDRDLALIRSIPDVSPTSRSAFCIHHVMGNIAKHGRRRLGTSFVKFMQDTWACYRAVSPDEFERLWQQLLSEHPTMASYLNEELYGCREKWAWAWVNTTFTAGVRTTGRVESENRTGKETMGTKTSVMQAFGQLKRRAEQQSVEDLQRVRDSSRMQHARPIEDIFPAVLDLVRRHTGPFAVKTCYEQMELSLNYRTETVHPPKGLAVWNEYAIKATREVGYDWKDGEHRHVMNNFANDQAYISTRWLLRLISNRGHDVRHLLKVSHIGSGSAVHFVAILSDGQYICDCTMGLNLGLPCRHFFQVLLKAPAIRFHIGLIRARWYQKPSLDISQIPPVSLESGTNVQAQAPSIAAPTVREDLQYEDLDTNPTSNPLDTPRARRTDTISAQTAHHEASAALRQLTARIQTQEQMDELLEKIKDVERATREEERRDHIQEPTPIVHKGRPRSQRLTGANEGPSRGGGGATLARRGGRSCGICRQAGHTRAHCPNYVQPSA